MKNFNNIKSFAIGLILLGNLSLNAQEMQSSVDHYFELGQGLQFKFNDGDYQFKMGGMMQPQIGLRKDF
jgi:hypothetical protein